MIHVGPVRSLVLGACADPVGLELGCVGPLSGALLLGSSSPYIYVPFNSAIQSSILATVLLNLELSNTIIHPCDNPPQRNSTNKHAYLLYIMDLLCPVLPLLHLLA
jgi:hypothetical protein